MPPFVCGRCDLNPFAGDELKIPESSRNCVHSFVEAVCLIEEDLVK